MLASSCRGELVHPRRLPRGERGVWGGAPGLDTARVPLPAIAVREHQNIKSGDHTHQPGRGGKYVVEFLGDWQGALMVDDFALSLIHISEPTRPY